MSQVYAQHVHDLDERVRNSVDRSGTMPSVTIADEARMPHGIKKDILHTVMPERGAFAQALNRRSARAAGIGTHESYMVKYTCGRVAAIVLRHPEPPAACVSEDEGMKSINELHDAVSIGWMLGCEADQPVNPHMVMPLELEPELPTPTPPMCTKNCLGKTVMSRACLPFADQGSPAHKAGSCRSKDSGRVCSA